MRKVTAVQLRQSVRRVARLLEEKHEPVLLELGRRAVGVIVPVRDFHERFALADAAAERARLVEEILADRRRGRLAVGRAIDDARAGR